MAAPSSALNKAQYDYLIKLLVIGDSGVGKSSLLLRFDEDKFTPNFISTIGIDFRVRMLQMDGKTVKLQIWDTGGQERFKTITQAYYRGAMGIMLVYDVTDPASFDNIRNWMTSLEQNASEGVNKILVGNKCDLVDKRVISTERGKALADEYKIKFFECSAKSSINVEEAFMTLAVDCKKRLFSDENAAKAAQPGAGGVKLQSGGAPAGQEGGGGCAC